MDDSFGSSLSTAEYVRMTQPDQLMHIAAVEWMTSLSKSAIYREAAVRRFPRQTRLREFGSVWRLSEIVEWMRAPMDWTPESVPLYTDGLTTQKRSAAHVVGGRWVMRDK